MINDQVPLAQLALGLKITLPQMMVANNIPGLSLAVIKGKQIILHLEFGVKNILTKEPIVPSTIFEGASFTKPLIGYGALKMCQQGMLALDKPLRSYLSEPYKDDPPYLSAVTLRHILHHTGGFPEHLGLNEKLELGFAPGSDYNYSNVSFAYLTHVLQDLTQGKLADYLQQHVLKPLNMNDSSFIWEEKYLTQAAAPHNRQGMPTEKWHPKNVLGASSLHTTPIDYAKFVIETMQQAKKTGKQNILNMLDEQFKIENNISSSLGWGIEKTADGEVFYHVGNSVNFKSLALVYRKQEFGIVFMTNGANSFKIFLNVLKNSIGGDHEPIADFEEFDKEDDKYQILSEEILSTWWKLYDM